MNVPRIILQIALLFALPFTNSLAGPPLECTVTGTGESLAVMVKIASPHPGEMVIKTPDGRTIWLQADYIPFLYPITDDFERLSEFVLNLQTRGSWFNDWGEIESVSVFGVDGSYEIIISDAIKSRRTSVMDYDCEFSFRANEQHASAGNHRHDALGTAVEVD